MNADVKKSVKSLAVASAVLLGLGGAALVLGRTGGLLWPCAMFELTGVYCLTCGATRAAVALSRLEIAASLFYNPFPILLTLFLLAVIAHQIICIARKKRREVHWMPAAVIIVLAIEIPFCLLRNFGVIAPI